MTNKNLFAPSVRATLAPAIALILGFPVAAQATPASAAPVAVAETTTPVEGGQPLVKKATMRTFYLTSDGKVTKDKPEAFEKTCRAANAAEARKAFGL